MRPGRSPAADPDADGPVAPDAAFWARAALAVFVRPWLWGTALRQGARTVPRGWWRHRPYLPVPDGAYLRFRLETAYGRTGTPTSRDLVRYLSWCRDTDRLLGAGSSGASGGAAGAAGR